MNITYVSGYYPEYSAKMIHEVAKRLVRKGCEVNVITSNFRPANGLADRSYRSIEFIDGVRVVRFKAISLCFFNQHYILYNPQTLKKITNILSEINSDIIHIHSLSGILGFFVGWNKKIGKVNSAIIATSHGIMAGYPNRFVEVVSRFLQRIAKSLIIDNCRFLTSVGKRDVYFWSHKGVPRINIYLIPNGVDTEVFRPLIDKRNVFRQQLGFSNEDVVVLFLAQFRSAKGINVLLESIPKVIKRNSHVKFLLIGTGPMIKTVEDSISRLAQFGLGDRVTLISKYVAEEDLPKYYNISDIYVLPSFVEGMPLSLMEAMSCGKPVIATSVGDVNNLVKNGANGLIIPPGNYQELAEDILYLAGNSRFRNLMGTKNAIKMKTYDWDKIADMYYSLYKEALSSNEVIMCTET